MSSDFTFPITEILPSGERVEIRLSDSVQSSIMIHEPTRSATNVLRGRVKDTPAPADTDIPAPHFLSTLREVEDSSILRNPAIQAVFPRAKALEVCDEYDVGPVVSVARDVGQGRITYAEAIKDGFLQRLWQYTRGFDIEKDSFPLQFGVPIPIAELHRPHVAGAKTWLQRVSTTERALELSLKVGALGGGVGAKHRVAITSKVETEGDCQTIAAEVSGSATIWRHLDTDERIFLLALTGVSGTWSAQPIAGDDPRHACAKTTDLVPIMRLLKRANAVVDRDYGYIRPAPEQATPPTLGSSLRMNTEREYKGTWRIGLSDDLPNIGGLSISSKFTHEVEWALEYTAGPELLGTYPSDEEWPLRWSHG